MTLLRCCVRSSDYTTMTKLLTKAASPKVLHMALRALKNIKAGQEVFSLFFSLYFFPLFFPARAEAHQKAGQEVLLSYCSIYVSP